MALRSPRRRIPAERIPALLEAATRVFCRCGYERAQMADVAREMGVSTGAVYQYVESKEALFDLAVRANAGMDPGWISTLSLPVKNPPAGATLAFLEEVLNRPGQWALLDAAAEKAKADNPRAELEGVLREQYGLMRYYRHGLVLLTRSALEFPGLVDVFVHGLRDRLLEQMAAYVEKRVAVGQFQPQTDAAATAAMLVQTIAWANHQRPFDPGLAGIPESVMEDTVITTLARGLLAVSA